jgi:hypothetical protein
MLQTIDLVENSKTTDLAALQKQLELGEHIKKGRSYCSYTFMPHVWSCYVVHDLSRSFWTDRESSWRWVEVLALISLKKFRHLRRSYHANEGPRWSIPLLVRLRQLPRSARAVCHVFPPVCCSVALRPRPLFTCHDISPTISLLYFQLPWQAINSLPDDECYI